MAKTVFLRLLWYKPELHCRTHRPECLHLPDVYSSTFVFFFFFCVHDRLHKVPSFCHFSILRTQPSCLYKLKLSLEITDWGYMPHCDKLTDFLEWRSEAFQAFFFLLSYLLEWPKHQTIWIPATNSLCQTDADSLCLLTYSIHGAASYLLWSTRWRIWSLTGFPTANFNCPARREWEMISFFLFWEGKCLVLANETHMMLYFPCKL